MCVVYVRVYVHMGCMCGDHGWTMGAFLCCIPWRQDLSLTEPGALFFFLSSLAGQKATEISLSFFRTPSQRWGHSASGQSVFYMVM